MNKNRTLRSKQVFSRYRDKKRIAKMGDRPFKRFPRKYFHLIDKGFNHHSGSRARSYNFIQRLASSVGASMQQVFEDRLKKLIVPTIEREILRKIRGVLK
jgi:hypothetical protein